MNMKLIRRILTVMSFIIIVLILVYMDYSDLSWPANKHNYLGLMACILNIWALVFLIREKQE
ncbi:MAG: hypothetical protein JW830_08850 [Bacteroidales bacterium]|nr:hypothetical protein [Bacteroidales bacterium]